jgi:hypothetical protein
VPETYHIVKAVLAVVLGGLAIAGGVILKNPDGDHFIGKFRDRLRVGRSLDQVDALAKIIRQFVVRRPSTASSDLMSLLIDEHIRKPILPTGMVAVREKGVVVLSPWSTEVTTATEGRAFAVTVPMSQLGCVKVLESLSASNAFSVSINGQRFSVPVTNRSAADRCLEKSIPDVAFWFSFAANAKP